MSTKFSEGRRELAPGVRKILLAQSVLLLAAGVALSCTKQEAKTAETVAVVVADDVCKVLEAQSDAAWVQLLCTAEGAASTVLVKMPRAQWSAIRAAHVDAGPGK